MLEIPESQHIGRQLYEELSGKLITEVVAGHTPHKFAFFNGDPAGYREMLVGKRIVKARSVAGFVEIEAEDARMLFGDGANIRYHKSGSALPEKHQLYIGFDDGSAITCSIQMYGGIWVFQDGQFDNKYYMVAQEKPSPLTGEFSAKYFRALVDCEKKNLSVKALLATDQRIPGLGNGVLQDILFDAGINPKSKIGDLGPEDFDSLFSSIKRILGLMSDLGGRDTEKDLYGMEGGYRTVMSAKNLGSPCPKCGEAIVRQAYMGGNVYFCPSCQKVR